ncbi:MAG: hypothetical protein ABIH28_03145 [archaeon]
MASLTLPISEEFKNQLKEFLWVNWSEIAREESLKKVIFENYIKKKNITDEEWDFCERIDWHPVDELPLREEFIKKLNKIKKGKFKKYNSVEELFTKIK